MESLSLSQTSRSHLLSILPGLALFVGVHVSFVTDLLTVGASARTSYPRYRLSDGDILYTPTQVVCVSSVSPLWEIV